MQNFSENVRTIDTHGLGWKLIAANDLQAGDVILQEQPLLITPHWEHERMKCVNCHQDSFVMCKKCQFFPLCLTCKSHNEFDCDFMFKATKANRAENQSSQSTSESIGISRDFLVKNYAIYAVLKFLLLMENERTRCCCEPICPPMIDLNDDYRASEYWHEQQENVVAPLMASGILPFFQTTIKKRGAAIDADFLHELCFLIDAHAFEVSCKYSEDSMKAVFAIGTRIQHNCVPNTVISFDDSYQMKIYAAVPIPSGGIIYNCYSNPLMGTSQRQHQLRLSRQILCHCPRCLDPTELGTHLSSLKCQQCTLGYITCSKPLGDGIWKCNECTALMTTDEVNKLLAELAEELAHGSSDLETYETLLRNYESKFHPNHFMMIDIKQNIASTLGVLLSNPYGKVEMKFLERKIEISEEMLPLIHAVQPGISKLYTIALYDYVVIKLELAELRFEKKQITREEYIETLRSANANIHQVVNMLSFEPTNSAEGHLAQRIILEKKQIEQNLQSITEEEVN